MEIQRIIDDSSLSTEAKVILLTAEIEKLLRSAPTEEVEVKLLLNLRAFYQLLNRPTEFQNSHDPTRTFHQPLHSSHSG